jgi:outer membrane protein assembly factor BamB
MALRLPSESQEAIITGAPAIAANETIYIGGRSGGFFALNPNGTLKWELQTGWAK